MILSTIEFFNYICRVTKQTESDNQHQDTPLAYNLNAINKLYLGVQSRKLGGLDIDRYFFVLSLIVKYRNTTQQCLSNCLQIDKASMVRIIDYLTANGYVKRELNANDRREYLIVPTPKAEQLHPQLVKSFRATNTAAFKGFDEAEKRVFYEMLDRVFQNLSGMPSDQYFIKYFKTSKTAKNEK